jgi:hypothetical protein
MRINGVPLDKASEGIITGAATDVSAQTGRFSGTLPPSVKPSTTKAPMFDVEPGGLAKLCRRWKRDSNRDRGDTSLTIPEATPKIKFFAEIFAKFCDFSRNRAKATVKRRVE